MQAAGPGRAAQESRIRQLDAARIALDRRQKPAAQSVQLGLGARPSDARLEAPDQRNAAGIRIVQGLLTGAENVTPGSRDPHVDGLQHRAVESSRGDADHLKTMPAELE